MPVQVFVCCATFIEVDHRVLVQVRQVLAFVTLIEVTECECTFTSARPTVQVFVYSCVTRTIVKVIDCAFKSFSRRVVCIVGLRTGRVLVRPGTSSAGRAEGMRCFRAIKLYLRSKFKCTVCAYKATEKTCRFCIKRKNAQKTEEIRGHKSTSDEPE